MFDPNSFDREGRPLDLESHLRLFADDTYRQVAFDEIGPYVISTVWLGFDHGFGRSEQPIIFETMVFAPNTENLGPTIDGRRYFTESDARTGHDETVTLIRATIQDEPTAVPRKAEERD